jgi:hypothetical protein
MLTSRRILLALCATTFTALLACSPALAAPVTVKLRVEGSTKTLFEGEVAASPETIETASSRGAHPCDYSQNGPVGGYENEGNESGTPTTALHAAALVNGLAFDAEWFGSGKETDESPGDFFVSQVGTDINQTSGEYASWGYAVNDTTAPVGGCQIALAPGNEVLWAYNYFNLKHLLSLSGPATANIGTPFTVHVVDGHSGEPIVGAEVGEDISGVTGSGPKTDANGNATITPSHTGTVTLKATRSDSVRSNGVVVCVHNGNDGTCGTTVPVVGGAEIKSPPPLITAPLPSVQGIKSGRIYARRSAPRLLRGAITVAAGATLREVLISLTRSYHGRCFVFGGSRERFVRAKCDHKSFFSVGSSESFSYLLPVSLPPGRYVYDIQALNDGGTATKLVSGISQVVFRVR